MRRRVTGVALGAVLARRSGRPRRAGGATLAGGSRSPELFKQVVNVRVQPLHLIVVLLVAGCRHALHTDEVVTKLLQILHMNGRVNGCVLSVCEDVVKTMEFSVSSVERWLDNKPRQHPKQEPIQTRFLRTVCLEHCEIL